MPKGRRKNAKHEKRSRGAGAAGSATSTQPDRAYAFVRDVKILTEQGNYVQASFSMLAQEGQQIFAFHHRDLCIVQQFRRHFVSGARKRRAET